MKVLIACEESQRVCIAFRNRGHEAYSCDIQEPSGGHPEWHILGDALIVNPWQFGHPEQKKTALWLKNLPPLQETENVYEHMKLPEKDRARIWWMGSNHSKERSKTYTGIAEAMAEQWGSLDEI